MERLVRLGRRHIGRLHRVRRWPVALGGLLAVLLLAVVVAVVPGWFGLATSLAAVVVGIVAFAVTALLRRLSTTHRAALITARDTRAVVEQMQRRLVAAVEKERLAAGDRHQALSDAIQRGQKLHEARLERLHRTQIEQLDALMQLFATVALRAPLPSPGGLAVDPSDLLRLVYEIQRRRPKLVLDLGGGRSTVWLAYALEKVDGRVVTIHHDPVLADQTREALVEHGLAAIAEVRQAPLRRTTVAGRTFRWYDTSAVADLTDIDLLVVGGPPDTTGPDARFPGVPVLEDRLAPEATVVLHDVDAQRTAEAARRWVEAVPRLSSEGGDTGRQVVLSYARRGSTLAAMRD